MNLNVSQHTKCSEEILYNPFTYPDIQPTQMKPPHSAQAFCVMYCTICVMLCALSSAFYAMCVMHCTGGCMLTRSITGVALCAGSPGLLGWWIIRAFEPTHTSTLYVRRALYSRGDWGRGGGPGGEGRQYGCLPAWVQTSNRLFNRHTHRSAVLSPLSSEALRGVHRTLMSNRVSSENRMSQGGD